MSDAGQVSFPETPSSTGVRYTSKFCYKSSKYHTHATSADRSENTGQICKRLDTSRPAANFNIALLEFIAARYL